LPVEGKNYSNLTKTFEDGLECVVSQRNNVVAYILL